jgi:hypothetical protein
MNRARQPPPVKSDTNKTPSDYEISAENASNGRSVFMPPLSGEPARRRNLDTTHELRAFSRAAARKTG